MSTNLNLIGICNASIYDKEIGERKKHVIIALDKGGFFQRLFGIKKEVYLSASIEEGEIKLKTHPSIDHFLFDEQYKII